jgi:hypothetical protein
MSREKILKALEAVKQEIDKYGVDDLIRNGQITTHKTDIGVNQGLEAIICVNPEIRVDTNSSELFAFTGGELVTINY